MLLYWIMIPGRSGSYRSRLKKRRVFTNILFGVLILAIIALVPMFYPRIRSHSANDRRQLRSYFEAEAFEYAFLLSGEMLKSRPLDTFLLTVHGFSAYQLANAQINAFDTLTYINESIWALRKALLSRGSSSDGIYYVLGKAYFYKGPEYADLAVYFLEKASAASFKAADIHEYLGLSYAILGDYRSSVTAFSQSLGEEPSDLLLLSIAQSYNSLEEFDAAMAYLIHCLEISRDFNTINAARLLLANILLKTGDIPAAEEEYLKLIEISGDNAEAHYQLGELYVQMGDLTRAIAEWRRAVRIDPAHGPARRRLN